MALPAEKFSINDALRRSPARIVGIQRRFMKQMNRRFGELMKDVRLSIEDRDCFGIDSERLIIGARQAYMQTKLAREIKTASPTQPRAYQFVTTPKKIDGFMDWLREQEELNVLQIVMRPGRREGMYAPWTDVYIDSTYQQGIRRSRLELRKKGYDVPSLEVMPGGISTVMNQPVHADRIGIIYARTFERLKTVTAIANTEIREKISDGLTSGLARGLAEGKHPKVIARELRKDVTNRLDKIGRTRARMIARTETARAHHVAMVTEYRQAAEDMQVTVMAEWKTAGFGVCDICIGFEEHPPWTLDEIEGMLPAHPNCRCVILPMKKKKEGAPEPTGLPPPIMEIKPYQPAKTLKEAEAWLIGRGLAGEVKYSKGGRLWGPKLSKADALKKFNIVNEEIYRFETTHNVKLPQVDEFFITGRKPGVSPMRGKAGQYWNSEKNKYQYAIKFGDRWSDQTWQRVAQWEGHNGKIWARDGIEISTAHNVRHEFAHIIDKKNQLTGRGEFRTLLRELDQVDGFTAGFISEYAKTNVREFFAVAFESYTSPGYANLPAWRAVKPIVPRKFPPRLERYFDGVLKNMREQWGRP